MSIKIDRSKALKAIIPWQIGGGGHGRYTMPPYLEAGKLKMYLKPTDEAMVKAITFERMPPYTTREWKGRFTGLPEANTLCHIGSGENVPSPLDEDVIFLNSSGTTYRLETKDDTVSQVTSLTGQDWTVERTFKIEWTDAKVELFVDGASQALHTTRVPDEPLLLLAEIVHTAYVGTTKHYLEVDENFFRW